MASFLVKRLALAVVIYVVVTLEEMSSGRQPNGPAGLIC